MPRLARPIVILFALGAFAPFGPALAQNGAALTCPQISSQINDQNAIMKHAQRIVRMHRNEDTGTTTSPDVTQANSDASAASDRAKTLLVLGRSKKCFQ